MSKRFRKLIAGIIICILLLAALSADAEHEPWDCPECGRTGNTGNFCGGCAHPAPGPQDGLTEESSKTDDPSSEPIRITDVQYLGKGMVKIGCVSGNNESVRITAYHYFNEAHNEGVERCFELSNCEPDQLNNYILRGFIPGQRYWIRAAGKSSSAWYDFSVPAEMLNDVSVKISKIEMIKLTDWEIEQRMKQFSAKEIESTCADVSTSVYYVFNERFSIGRYKGDKEFVSYQALIMPNGDVIPEEEMIVYQWPSGTHEALTGWLWHIVYSAYGCIPTGQYSYINGFENYTEKELVFMVTE